MLDNTLIEKALALTGKIMEDMEIFPVYYDWRNERFADDYLEFSIEKFCYYLLSPKFIEEYYTNTCMTYPSNNNPIWEMINMSFWKAIYKYQSGNEEPLTNLLAKI